MDLRTYVEESEEAWMWIYGDNDLEAINLEHVATIRIQSEGDKMMVICTTITEDEMVVHTTSSGGDARDWMKRLLASLNEREGGRRESNS